MGKYRKITNEIIRDIFKKIKSVDNDEYLEYEDLRSGLSFELNIHTKHTTDKASVDGFVTEWEYYETQIPTIFLILKWNWDNGRKDFQNLYIELRDVVRHEIEHLTQYGHNQKFGKRMNNMHSLREKIQHGEKDTYKYYMLKSEIDANIQGLYSKSKALKKDFQIVIDTYLTKLVETGTITQKQKGMVYSKWKSRIPKIGGIPKLK